MSSAERLFLNALLNSCEDTCVGVSFLIRLLVQVHTKSQLKKQWKKMGSKFVKITSTRRGLLKKRRTDRREGSSIWTFTVYVLYGWPESLFLVVQCWLWTSPLERAMYWRFKMLLTQNNNVFSSNASTRFQSITARGWKSRNRNFPRNQFIRNLTLASLKLQKLLQAQKVGYFEKENYLWKLNFVWHTCSEKITLSLRSNFCKHKKLATLKRKIIYENLILYDTLVARKLRFL